MNELEKTRSACFAERVTEINLLKLEAVVNNSSPVSPPALQLK